MKPSQDNYPIFEANQVLSNSHLNQVFSYLDEQERLTRANLIGIGIVCGLEISLDQQTGPTLNLTRGCGVTSQGYLIVEPEDVALVSYRTYTPPTDPQYPPFMKDSTSTYDLWELFPAGEPNTTTLDTPADFLADKAVLLFLELKKEGLRNCSLSNCDDRGAQITVTLRRLLVGLADLKEIMVKGNALQGNLTFADLEATLLERLNLPELHLPRIDVPNTGPATSQQIYAAFLAVFQSEQLATNTGAALTALYEAFQPLLQQNYPSNPFTKFLQNFGFLDAVPATTTQVRFLQYYWDLFDDLLKGYYEFLRKGVELLCFCCPPEGLFPRHLMLGVLFPEKVSNPGIYRQQFLASAITSGCEGRARELEQLFARLVEMVNRFTNTPPLPQAAVTTRGQSPDIRITPSKLGDQPLSDKAIPYYYLENGTPPLFQLWNSEKTRLNRANQNLSYRSDEYLPAAPPFVTNALRYDLEPYNFLRIEGHLGKDYQTVMRTLLALKSRYRLPVEFLALQTGAFDENIPVDLSKEGCRFQDLDTLYATLTAESTCLFCNEVQYFYTLPFDFTSPITTPVKSKLPLLMQCAPDFLVQPKTLGRLFEDYLAFLPGGAVPEIDPNVIINFLNNQNMGQNISILFYVIIYIEKLYEQFTPDLQQFDFASFQKRYRDLVNVTQAIEKEREQSAGNIQGTVNLLNWEELDDRLEDLIYQCKLEAFQALEDEYTRRVREVKQKLFLSFFLRNNPGIQHKAGAPLGGTFVVVYHHEPAPELKRPAEIINNLKEISRKTMNRVAGAQIDASEVLDALSRISAKREIAADADVRLLFGAFTGKAPDLSISSPPRTGADSVIENAVSELVEGTVIADFYLPYLCCSDCSPVQFVLPKAPPNFSLAIGCTNANDQAEVTITAEGGLGPYSFKLDDQDYQPLGGVLELNAGQHALKIRDQEGVESAPQSISIDKHLALGAASFDCLGESDYVASFQISGGTPPYSANRGTVSANQYSSDALPSDQDVEIVITDSRKCSASQTVKNSCRPQLAFSTKLGCTSANNQAPVEIVPTGGKPPYQVQLDGANPVAVAGTLQLQVGSHTLSVRDDAGTVTPPQTLVVPAPMTLAELEFSCQGTTSYRSAIRIDGGTPPYVANGKPIVGNQFVSDPIASGAKFSIAVTDHNNCDAKIEVQHSCDVPCDLPCGGQSRLCAYRLWVQPASEQAPYKSYKQDQTIKFRFNGKDIKIDTTNLPFPDAGMLNTSFQQAITRFVKALNKAIGQALVGELGSAGKNRLGIIYAPAATDPFGVIRIEHFVCETFSLEFNYAFAKPTPAFAFAVRYSNEPIADVQFDGVVFSNLKQNNTETRVPAFDCSERNLCSGSAYAKVCEGPEPKLELGMKRIEGNVFQCQGMVNNMPAGDVAAWVWDFPTAQPSEPFYEGQETTPQLKKPGGTFSLTAITDKGCFSSAQDKIPLK
jgi:hypothetical protein